MTIWNAKLMYEVKESFKTDYSQHCSGDVVRYYGCTISDGVFVRVFENLVSGVKFSMGHFDAERCMQTLA